MKIKMVCGSLLATAALGSGLPVLAQAVQSDNSVVGRVIRQYSGSEAIKKIPKLIERMQELSTSSDPRTRAMAMQTLESLQSGKYENFIVQFSDPVAITSTSVAQPMSDPPPQPGSIQVNQWCSYKNGYTYVNQTTDTWEPTSPGGSDYGWVQTKSLSWQVTSCPANLLP